jgi:serine/threonine protein kinase
LKPSNIIISNEGQAHIVDFGIAKILPVNQSRETQNLTNTGEVFGSPAYMSPEQGMGYNLEARSDIYSLGCVMYQALTGRVPFEAINPIQTIVQHLSEKPPPMNTRLYGQSFVLKSLEQVILKCLEKDPSDRYQSMKDLQIELTRIQNGKKITARARREEPLLTRAGIAKIALAVLLNMLVVTSAIGQYDSSVKEKRRAEQLISSANALSKLMYDAGIAMGGYSVTKNALFADRFDKISALIPPGVKLLKELSAGNEERSMKAIEDASDKGLRTLSEAKQEIDSNNETSDNFRQRHMYKEIRKIADDLQTNLQILTAKSHSDLADTHFEGRIKFILMLELLALFVADVTLTISMMREVQRTARKQIWQIKN